MLRTISLALTVFASAAQAECSAVGHLGAAYTVCTVEDPDRIGLWLYDDMGAPYGDPAAIPEPLEFALNGGMYHDDRRPVGFYLSEGVQVGDVITREGPGNFGLLPNGVFCVSETAQVIESTEFAREMPLCRIATQSGPMLVIDGDLHPRFLTDSTSFKYRAGVGVDDQGIAYFAISGSRVRFHDFATLFRDTLGAQNALFLDGSVTRLYAPELGRNDAGPPMGPILGARAR